ncbi:MAG: hypothetical protein QI199_05545 [Candidatus Korarchaeota archaeon]|nr:hypothetical protein [Candidatus Korarchaeota archaeon]
MDLAQLALVVFLMNLPFGYWRAHVRRASRQWFLAIHIPVILVIALRFLSGLGWALITFPVLVGAFFLGQLSGGLIYRLMRSLNIMTTACIFMDVFRWESIE